MRFLWSIILCVFDPLIGDGDSARSVRATAAVTPFMTHV